ncbi:uncharacterized protein BX663DRAFT_539768 [Cokeromyces recurvatus]|uniref:uncharacterized protein n=1 Tax=Cokeromyces recurvatus TaxID=90255 RepID=UPI00221E5C21|nr:uncharacterized protein BX663DRAFT_539768 [Cokeromyces recurvatus]KAI7906996.1 hypothetical protein BX663DRAFT_539768 [Cokeromyces recurvatus]
MNTSILTNAENTIVLQQRRPSDILEESYVAQNVNSNSNSRKNSYSSATTATGELTNYSSFSTAVTSSTTNASISHDNFINSTFWSVPTTSSNTTVNIGHDTFCASQPNSIIHPLDSNLMFQNWNSTSFSAQQMKQGEWNLQELQPQHNIPFLTNPSSSTSINATYTANTISTPTFTSITTNNSTNSNTATITTSTSSTTTTNNNNTNNNNNNNNNNNTIINPSIPNNNNTHYMLNNIIPQDPTTNDYSHIIPMEGFGYGGSFTSTNMTTEPPSMVNTAYSTPNSGLMTPPVPNYFMPRHSLPTMMNTSMMSMSVDHHKATVRKNRRNSSNDMCQPQRTYGKRNSSHPSVASVVSLTAHEPVAKIINGIEHITFLYSHDRLVREYTVRTDVHNVNINDIGAEFRMQNAIYPRANVHRDEYDGNRWDYETSCNELGWRLCWLNSEQLVGRRGLIQRAVDSYRNRHAEMRSRRVTRQEKVANGTLRKRRSKKSSISNNTIE